LIGTVAFFALLAWINCDAIERWETLPHPTSKYQALPLATVSGILGLFLVCILFPFHPRPAALLATASISALLLALLDRMRHRLTLLALRAAADLVLLTPALIAPLSYLAR
jgi:hypothetical protein